MYYNVRCVTGHVAWMGNIRNAYKVYGQISIINSKDVKVWTGFLLAQDRVYRKVLVNTVIKLQVP